MAYQPDPIEACHMTVFRPGRQRFYVMRWTDPDTKQRRQQSTKRTRARDAFDVAEKRAAEILAGLPGGRMRWDDFTQRYKRLVNDQRIGNARQPWFTACNWIAKFGPPQYLDEITTAWVTEWQAFLRDKGLATDTVAGYSARLKAALRWAVDQDFLRKAPKITVDRDEAPRSRAITPDEFQRILALVSVVRPDDAAQWNRLLRAQWESGFRIAELVALSWDAGAPIRLEWTGHRFPLVVMAPRSNKSRKLAVRPVTREFWSICCETPTDRRTGSVFPAPTSGPFGNTPPITDGTGPQMTVKRVIKVIAEIGKTAGVVTNAETEKYATSHDLRRGFTTRMDDRLTLAELQKWMGHADIRTTLTYYHTKSAEELAAKVWGVDRMDAKAPGGEAQEVLKSGPGQREGTTGGDVSPMCQRCIFRLQALKGQRKGESDSTDVAESPSDGVQVVGTTQ